MLTIVKPGQDQLLNMIASINGGSAGHDCVDTGIYQIGHFSFDMCLKAGGYKVNDYPTLENIGCYGVCDHYSQILDQEPLIQQSPDRKFVIAVSPIVKANQEPSGGWRWHKWGEYIGKHNPQHEYLYNEPDINLVYVYHVYEILN